MIFIIKYKFVILELIEQPYFDLKRNARNGVEAPFSSSRHFTNIMLLFQVWNRY